MAITPTSLCSWDAVEARSDLERFFLVRDNLPDEAIIQALEAQRGQGRDDFSRARHVECGDGGRRVSASLH